MLQRGGGSDEDLLHGRFGASDGVEGMAMEADDFAACTMTMLDPAFQKHVQSVDDRELFIHCLLADGFESWLLNSEFVSSKTCCNSIGLVSSTWCFMTSL